MGWAAQGGVNRRTSATRRRPLFVAIALATALIPAAVTAQGPATLEFSFSNPGARAMGFGGAFAALADDATAAFANPAGLVQLARPEVSFEARRWSYATEYLRSGRLEGEPAGIGLDDSVGLRTGTSRADLWGLSFASVVIPLGRSRIALYRHQLARFEAHTETQGVFGVDEQTGGVYRYYDTRNALDLDAVSTGVSWAFQVMERLSVGLGVAHHEGVLAMSTEWYLPDDDTLESRFGPNHFLPARLAYRTTSRADGADWAVTVGVLWAASPAVSVGGFYRQGPEFPIASEGRTGLGLEPEYPAGTVIADVRGRITLPNVYGVGVAYRAQDSHLTLAGEWDRVEYSRIPESIADNPEWEIGQTIEDGNEFHVGGEYAFLESVPIIAVRIGVWLDPDHRLRSTEEGPYERAVFAGGDEEVHLAIGFGLAFERFQVDVGLDFSTPVDTASISLIYSF